MWLRNTLLALQAATGLAAVVHPNAQGVDGNGVRPYRRGPIRRQDDGYMTAPLFSTQISTVTGGVPFATGSPELPPYSNGTAGVTSLPGSAFVPSGTVGVGIQTTSAPYSTGVTSLPGSTYVPSGGSYFSIQTTSAPDSTAVTVVTSIPGSSDCTVPSGPESFATSTVIVTATATSTAVITSTTTSTAVVTSSTIVTSTQIVTVTGPPPAIGDSFSSSQPIVPTTWTSDDFGSSLTASSSTIPTPIPRTTGGLIYPPYPMNNSTGGYGTGSGYGTGTGYATAPTHTGTGPLESGPWWPHKTHWPTGFSTGTVPLSTGASMAVPTAATSLELPSFSFVTSVVRVSTDGDAAPTYGI